MEADICVSFDKKIRLEAISKQLNGEQQFALEFYLWTIG